MVSIFEFAQGEDSDMESLWVLACLIASPFVIGALMWLFNIDNTRDITRYPGKTNYEIAKAREEMERKLRRKEQP